MSQTTMGVNTLNMSQTRVSALSHQIYLGTAWSSSLELSKFSLGHPEERPTSRVGECMKPLARKDMGLGRASKVSVRASPCPLRWKSRHQASTMSHASASNERRSSFEIMHGPNKWHRRNLSWHLVQMSICNWSIESHGAKNIGSDCKEKKNIRKLSSCITQLVASTFSMSCDLPGMERSVGQGQSKAENLLASVCPGNSHRQKLCHSMVGESSVWRVPLSISSAGVLNVLKLCGWEHPYWH